jgi:hypothetical protein
MRVRIEAEVTIVSERLDRTGFPKLPIDRAPSVEAALASALERQGRGARVLVLPEGAYVIATVRGKKLAIGRAWQEDAAA